jgi:hypothetical protein
MQVATSTFKMLTQKLCCSAIASGASENVSLVYRLQSLSLQLEAAALIYPSPCTIPDK